MGIESAATWDREHNTWDGREELFGTVSVFWSTQELRIRRSNFRLLSDISSKESTLQLMYDVLQQTPFFNEFLVTADVPEIYMEMLHICPRPPGQTFDEPPFEEEILAFLRFLGHSGAKRRLTNVNINKLH
nr:hypothetical protein [Tanacetum cinerariifolium]